MPRRMQALLVAATLVALLPTPDLAAGKRYALVVGVKEYRANQPLPSLGYPENDAERLADVLRGAGYTVTLMTQTAGRERATQLPMADYIRDRLDTLLTNPFLDPEEDVVIVALAGHGVYYDLHELDAAGKPVLDAKGQPTTSPRFYFCPADADLRDYSTKTDERRPELQRANDVTARNHLIDVDELYRRLEKCRAGGKLLLVDACRNDPSKPRLNRAANSLSLPPIPDPPGGVAAYFACSQDQEAKEDPDLEHGVFFNYVIKGLKGEADASRPNRPADRRITLDELVGYVSPEVYDHVSRRFGGAKQAPELKGTFRVTIPLLEIAPSLVGGRAGETRSFGTSPGIEMAWIPPGTYTMGSPAEEQGRAGGEERVEVEITRGFWIGRTEVTQELWRSVMRTEPWSGKTYVEEGDDHPATYVSWEDALEFCESHSARERRAGRLPEHWAYRLPTEAEWEYACRAGSTTPWSFGSDLRRGDEYAWHQHNAALAGEKFAHRVGIKRPNHWGLHDVHGNVSEWCWDSDKGERAGGIDPVHFESSTSRSSRGGTWGDVLQQLGRSASRWSAEVGERSPHQGFRLVAGPSWLVPRPVDDAAELDRVIAAHRGEIVVVSFWATWCIPCYVEFPHVVALAKRFGDDRVAVVTMNVDGDETPPAKLAAKLHEHGVKLTSLRCPRAWEDTSRFWNFESIPFFKVYGRDGRLVQDFHNPPTTEEPRAYEKVAKLVERMLVEERSENRE